MPKKRLVSRSIYYIGKKGRYLGKVEAPDNDPQAAIKKGIEELGVPEKNAFKVTAVVDPYQ